MLRFSGRSAQGQIKPFLAQSGEYSARGVQLLMSHPFFSLSKTPRYTPIDYASGSVAVLVETGGVQGIATIWDADILIWVASQITEARDHGRDTTRLIHARPYEILTFLGWGLSKRSYDRLRGALARLTATRITTSLGHGPVEGLRRFHWIEDWREQKDEDRRANVLEIILPEWLYSAITAPGACLTIDKAFFRLSGGLERWLYLLIRKHGGYQEDGWQFDLRYLYQKSGLLSRSVAFSMEIRRIVRRQSIPGYELSIVMSGAGKETLKFKNLACGKSVDADVLSRVKPRVLSRTKDSCHQWSQSSLRHCNKASQRSPNLYNNLSNNFLLERGVVNSASSDASLKPQNPSAFGLEDEAKDAAHGASILKSFSKLSSIDAHGHRLLTSPSEPGDRQETPGERLKQGPSPSLLHSRLFIKITEAGDA